MELDAVLFKTDKGLEEVRNRSLGLSPRLRSLLVMVDGRLRVTDLIERARSLGGSPELVEQLVTQGLVAGPNGHAVAVSAGPSAADIAQAKTVPLPAGLSAAEEARRIAAAKAEIVRRVKLHAGMLEGRPLIKAASSAHTLADIGEAITLVHRALSADHAEAVAELEQTVRKILRGD